LYAQARARSKKRHYLAFDEWNVWYRTQNAESVNGHGKFAQHLVEEKYTLDDALVVAEFLNSFLRHADVVKIANLAQIVNVIAPILTEKDRVLLQSIYFPLQMYSKRRNGSAMQTVVHGPGYESPTYGYVNMVDNSAILDKGELHAFFVNRSIDETATVELHTSGFELKTIQSADLVTGKSADAQNTFDDPEVVHCQKFNDIRLMDNKAIIQLPPLSVVAITFTVVEKE
jgi:alpha-N-arabinofuranosidase